MKIRDQITPELTKLGLLINGISTTMLTFVNANQDLVSQPMGPVEMDDTGAIWFFTDINSEKTRHLNTLNLTFNGESDGIYVSLSGNGEIITDEIRKKELWTPFVKPWFPDGPESPNLGLLKFKPLSAEYWESPHSSVIRLFAMAASIVAAKPIGLGDHKKLDNL